MVVGDEFIGVALGSVGFFEDVGFFGGVVELTRGAIKSDEDFFAEFVTSGFDGFGDGFQGVLGGGKSRGKSTFVTDGGGKSAFFEFRLEGVENLGSGAKGFGEGREFFRNDHEFLEVNRGVAMRAAVEDIHHRHWENLGVWSTEVFVKWLADLSCSGFGAGERNGQDRVGADFFLRRGAIHSDHRFVHGDLVSGIDADERRGEEFGDVENGFVDTLPEVFGLVAITKLDGFMLTGTRSAWDSSATNGSACELDVRLDGRIATGIKDLAGANGKNGRISHKVVDLVVFGKVKPLRKQVPERVARRFAVLIDEPSVPNCIWKTSYLKNSTSAGVLHAR